MEMAVEQDQNNGQNNHKNKKQNGIKPKMCAIGRGRKSDWDAMTRNIET
jgi:hypothetical protein